MKKYLLTLLVFALCMLVTAAGAASIVAPGHPHGGLLPPGSTGVFPVAVGGLTDAQGVHFNLTFNSTLLSVESVSASSAIPGSNVTATYINNEDGWVQVAVTNTEGITVNETWPLTPLVDITFRSTTNEGASAIEFAGTPTYSQGGDFMPEEFWTNFGRIKVGDPATIRAPSGTLAYGESRTFAVGVNNLTGATQIWFELMYDGSHLVIDDIAPTLPGAVITGASANNGIYEFEPVALASVSEEIGLNLQQYHHRNFAWVTLEIPGGLTTTGYTDVVDITFRPTNLTGTGDLDFYYHCTYQDENESTQLFDLQVPGQIVTNGGGSYPVLGEFKAPSGTVDTGSQKVLPLMVRSLDNAEEAYVWAEWNSTVINATSLSLSATARDAGVTLEGGDVYSYVYDNISVGYLYAFVGNLTRLNTASWTPLLDLTVRANTTSGRTPVDIFVHEIFTVPRENVSIIFPPALLENGEISITVPEKADLRGIIVDPPQYVKKYADNSLHFNQTMIIENIGTKAVTEDFKIQGEFGSNKANITVSDDIAPRKNITYHMMVNVVPGYNKTDLSSVGEGHEEWYAITTGGNISMGDYTIGLGIDVDNDVEEINEENNYEKVRVDITRPDLVPIWKMEFVSGPSSSNTTILDTSRVPGTWRVTFGAKNIGNVFAFPTTLYYSVNGGVPQAYSVPRLEPGENWTKTISIDVGRTPTIYRVEVNANRTEEAETDYANNIYEERVGSGAPVTVILPKVSGSTGDDTEVAIWITNISGTLPVTEFMIPVKYDPTVCNLTSVVPEISGVKAETSYGRVTLSGKNLELRDDTPIATLKMQALTDSGRTSILDSQKSAYVMTGKAYLEMEISRGAFVQENKTDAAVAVFAPRSGPAGQNQTISVTVQNQRLNPVTVSANLTANDDTIWAMQNINLTGRASKTFTINTWQPTGGTYFLNATITGDDVQAGNNASRSIDINNYKLEITDQNKLYWDSWYGYNKSVLKNEYFTLGTYFTANQSGIVNATLSITYPDGTPVDKSAFELYYYYPARQSVYGYDSTWNSAIWYYIAPKELGDFNYSITLEARDTSAYVNGTIKVREPNVDIKVMNTTVVTTTDESVTMTFPVFNRTPSEGRNVQILLSAGADGRTLQGLESLIGYPHGCPEQVMSPALVALRVKQYYENRNALNDNINTTVRTAMQNALGHMNASGYNAQQSSGGWAWGPSTPSMFYTLYPNYVITELLMDNDSTFWDVDASMNGIDLNKSAYWLIQKQRRDGAANGSWSDWGYISNDAEWTGFISENLVNEYPYLNETLQGEVNASLDRSCRWLLEYKPDSEPSQAISYAIFGLAAIRDHGGIGNATDIDDQIKDLQGELKGRKFPSGGDFYWPGVYSGEWYAYEPTASAILALNRAGSSADDAAVSGGIRYLIGTRAGRSYSGGWGSTRTSAAVINTLTNVVPQTDVNFTVDVKIETGDGETVWSREGVEFNNTSFRSNFPPLSIDELNTLYGSDELNDTAKVIISNKNDAKTENPSKLSVSIDSFEQVPKSIAIATIPDMYIDPLATDFELQIVVPDPGALNEGDERDVRFTIDNTKDDSIDQNTMIIEIPISNEVNFTGNATGADAAYYLTGSTQKFISHMYNATEKILYIYPGSDNASAPSVCKGETKTFSVPLTFGASGNITVEARAYPMYNDTWMALGTGSTYVLGYGNVTLAAVDETNAAVDARFYVNGTSVGSGTSVNTTLLEGTYPVAIKKDSVWINSSVNVTPSESVTYTAHFASDRRVPYIAQAEGTAGEIQVMPPAIEDTISDDSPVHWNAATKAMKSFNSTIASSGGRATIAVQIPTVSRKIGTVKLNENVTVLVRNATGSYGVNSSEYSLEGGVLTLFNIDTADVKEVSVKFEGRKLGDVQYIDGPSILDALAIAQSTVGGYIFIGNGEFYADVDGNGLTDIFDALYVAQLTVGLVDSNYQPL